MKKQSFGRFPSLGGNRNKQGDLAILLIRIAKNPIDFIAWKRYLQLWPGIGEKTAEKVIEIIKETDIIKNK